MANEQAVNLRLVMTAIKTGLALLNQRLLALLALLMSCGLFAWVMVAPDPTRLAAATLFTALSYWKVFVPVVPLQGEPE